MLNILKHHLNIRTVVLHLLPIAVIILIVPDDGSIIQIYGGIPNDKTNIAAAIIEIMTWNLCVIPPILLCYQIFNTEFSKVKFHTIIRSEKMDIWW